MALILEIKPAEGPESRIRLQPGNNRFTVRVGDVYRIFDDQTGLTPEGVTVRRIDNSLIVDGLPSAATGAPVTVEFAEFYTLCSAGSPCTLEVQPTLGSAPVAVTPATASIGALADGSFVLYDPSYVPPEPPPEASTFDTRVAWYGLGGLAIAGLAAGGGGGGGGGDGPPVGRNDGTLKYTGAPFTNSRTPTLVGEGEPGAQVLVRIDIDGNGTPDVSYATTVGADFRWQVDLATAVPTSGALPPGGLPDAVTIGITSETSQGLVSLDPFVLSFDGVPPVPALVDAVAADNIVNGPEKAAGVVVSGTSEPNGTVVVTWGGQSVAAPVSPAGVWQATFAAAAVPADGTHPVSVVAYDQAGNAAEAAVVSVTVDTQPPALAVTSVAGEADVNGVVAIADSDVVSFRGTSDPGVTVQVQWNGIARDATVGNDGQWTIDFTEVPPSAGGNFGYSIVATNAIGNVAAAAGNVYVDLQPPAPPGIATVAGDNIVTPEERSSGVAVAGSSEPGASIVVTWGSTTRQTTADGAGNWQVGFASGELPTVASPGANTLITATATDSVGNASDSASLPVFIQQPFQPPTISVVAGNDVVNAAERNAGVTLSGTVDANAPGVTVTWGAFTGTDSTVSGGTWSITVPTAQVPQTSTPVVAAITGSPDIQATRPVTVDIDPPAAPAIGPVEGDDIVSVVERTDGVTISGTAEAGSTVQVTWGTANKTGTADGSGNWSVSFAEGELPAAGSSTVSAVATDTAGNQGPAGTRTVTVQAPFNPPTIGPVETDDIVNAAERSDGVTLSGTADAGVTSVAVQWGSFNGTATVAGTSWTLSVPAGQVPADGNTTIVATNDGPGGGAQATRAVLVDTTPPVAPQIDPVTGDDSIDPLLEALPPGFAISGTAEAGATVTVTLDTPNPLPPLTATAGPNGGWQVSGIVTAGQPPGPVIVSAQATDAAGNVGPAETRTITLEGLLGFGSPGGSDAQFFGAAITTPAPPSLDALVALEDPTRHLA